MSFCSMCITLAKTPSKAGYDPTFVLELSNWFILSVTKLKFSSKNQRFRLANPLQILPLTYFRGVSFPKLEYYFHILVPASG